MKNLIGTDIEVYLKCSNNAEYDVRGILIEVTEKELYVQQGKINHSIFVIPRDNVKYCAISSLPVETKVIQQTESVGMEENPIPDNVLEVYINNELATEIPLPPTFKLDVWNDNIMRVIGGNPDVKMILAGRTQKSIDYCPGKVYIETVGGEKAVNSDVNTFSMSKDITTEYLNPAEMVTRFNQFLKKDDK